MNSNAALFLHDDLDELRQLEAARRLKPPLVLVEELSPEHQANLADFAAGNRDYASLAMEVRLYVQQQSEANRLKDPYRFSDLPERLGLQLWEPRDGLLLLVGLSPTGAVVDWSWENYMGVSVTNSPRIKNALPLVEADDYYTIPVAADFAEEIADAKRMKRELGEEMLPNEVIAMEAKLRSWERCRSDPVVLEKSGRLRCHERLLSRLTLRWMSTDHERDGRFPPTYFVNWADKQGLRPLWREWAVEAGLWGEQEAVYRAPYFDPDSPTYPEYLHIAVRAWEEAQKGRSGTPKQRIEVYLSERYPGLTEHTRKLISSVANWDKAGGRPRKGE